MSTLASVHRDSHSAWEYLVCVGGLELDGRDADFEAALLDKLAPSESARVGASEPEIPDRAKIARYLADRLRNTPLDKFLSAFFQIQQPYFLMFQQILRYFEKAGAKEGRDHWRLSMPDGTSLDLDHFRTQLTHVKSIRGNLQVPALDVRSAWKVFDLLESPLPGQVADPGIPHLLQHWQQQMQEGHVLPLDRDMLKQQLPRELHSICDFVCAMASVRAAVSLSRNQLHEALLLRNRSYPAEDALDIWSIAQSETDLYLANIIRRLLAAREFALANLARIERTFAELAADFPLKVLKFDVSIEQIEEILQLPIWKERNELYAVWVGTEIIDCLEGHLVRLFHDDGKLRFEFRETRLAAVLSSHPPLELFGEKRTPIAAGPPYVAHTHGVQPDYGIWSARKADAASCVIAVECKHYKKSGGREFSHVLSDYAYALPRAKVCLVSHGPIGKKVSAALAPGVRDRCIVIPELRADRPGALERLRACVQKAVGPVAATVDPALRYGCALVIDASPSMRDAVHATQARNDIVLLRFHIRADVLVAVDTEIRLLKQASDENLTALLDFTGSGTQLSDAVRLLGRTFARVVVATDRDGLATLAEFDTSGCPHWNAARHHGVQVVEVTVGD